MSLFEADLFTGRHRGWYLHRTSHLLRQQMRQDVPFNRNAIDRHLRLFSMETVRDSRVSAKLWLVRSCDEWAASSSEVRELLLSHGCLRELTKETSGTLPAGQQPSGWRHVRTLEDHVACLVCRFARVRVPTWKYWVLSCDGTVKIALALTGYQRNIFRTLAAKAHVA